MKIVRQHNPNPITELSVEKIQLDTVKNSGEGTTWTTSEGNICFLDKYWLTLDYFDQEGHFVGKKLGRGRSNGESLMGHYYAGAAMSDEGELGMTGSSGDYEYYSKDIYVINRFYISYSDDKRIDDGSHKNFKIYSFPDDQSMVTRLKDGKLYMSMNTDDPEFCLLLTPKQYLEGAYHLGVVDLKEGKDLPMEIQGFPAVYRENPSKYPFLLDNIDFDFDSKGNLYLGYNADPLIYVFDDERNPIHAFGLAGKNMNTSYENMKTIDDLQKVAENFSDKGYYTWIEYIDQTDVLFRSYKKGSHSEYDGLQAYSSKGQLLADAEVPKGFKVIGYIAPYYYSQIYSDEEASSLYIYRFKLQ